MSHLNRRCCPSLNVKINWSLSVSGLRPPPDARHFWQAQYYDFNLWTERKPMEKLG
jgi:hypothetical protein